MLKISGATLCLCLLTVLVLFPGTCSPASVKDFGKLSHYATLLLRPLLFLRRKLRFHVRAVSATHTRVIGVVTSSTA